MAISKLQDHVENEIQIVR